MKHVKWLAPLALAFALSPAHAQTWKKLNTGIARDVSPNQIGVDIGTNASSYVSIGNIVAGAFYLPYTQVSGLYPYGKGTAGTGNNATANGFSASNQALFLQGTLTGSGLGPHSLISITDTATGSGTSFLPGLWVAHNIGASAGEGSRVAFQPILRIDNPLTDASNRGLFYIAGFPQTYVTKSLGGASGAGNSRGDVYGGGSLAQLESGATYVHSITGHESNVSVQTGASVDYKTINTIIAVNSDAVAGSTFNAMSAYLTDSTASAKWALGISFGSPLGKWPFDTSSTLIGSTAPSTGSRVANYGVDLSGVTFSTGAFKSTGFLVSPTGATTVASLASTAGVTATTGAFSGAVSGTTGTFSGIVSGTDGTFAGVMSAQAISLPAPATKTANYTVDSGATKDSAIIFNGAGSLTITLPTASSFSGRILRIKTIAAQTVVSATSNVVPLAGGAAGTAILAATAGKWADLQSDGSNWIIMASN